MTRRLPNFDDLVAIAESDPQALEQLRQKICLDIINSASPSSQRKLKGLQFRIDMERRRAKTPLACCIKLSEMMHESFGQLRLSLNELQGIPQSALQTFNTDPPVSHHSPCSPQDSAAALQAEEESNQATPTSYPNTISPNKNSDHQSNSNVIEFPTD